MNRSRRMAKVITVKEELKDYFNTNKYYPPIYENTFLGWTDEDYNFYEGLLEGRWSDLNEYIDYYQSLYEIPLFKEDWLDDEECQGEPHEGIYEDDIMEPIIYGSIYLFL